MTQGVKGKVTGGDIDDEARRSERLDTEPIVSASPRNYGSFWGRLKKS